MQQVLDAKARSGGYKTVSFNMGAHGIVVAGIFRKTEDSRASL